MSEELSPIQKVLLDTFKAFDNFCKENNIQYFAAYGTLLGAVRHKGFIPWDDDIDVFLLRKDYDKLLSLKDVISKTGYSLSDLRKNGHPYGFAKFYDVSKTYIEFRHFSCVIGPFIDLFPLDECNDTSIDISERLNLAEWKYRKSIAQHSWSEIWSDVKALNFPEACAKVIKKVIYAPGKKKYKNDILKIEAELREVTGDYLRPYFNAAYKTIKFPKAWFRNTISVPFENLEISIPIDYDAFLRYTYNDYMTLPPIEKRSGGHRCFFMDLNGRKTYKDALDANPYTPTHGMSLSTIRDEFKNRAGFKKR